MSIFGYNIWPSGSSQAHVPHPIDVDTGQLADTLRDRIPKFREAVRLELARDLKNAEDAVFTQPGYVIDNITCKGMACKVSWIYSNNHKNSDYKTSTYYSNNHTLTLRVTLLESIPVAKAPDSWIGHGSSILAPYGSTTCCYSKAPDPKAGDKETLKMYAYLETSFFAETPPASKDLATNLATFIQLAKQVQEKFKKKLESLDRESDADMADSHVSVAKARSPLPDRQEIEGFNRRRAMKAAEQGEGVAKECPIFQNNGQVIQAVRERPLPKMPKSKDPLAQRERVFVRIFSNCMYYLERGMVFIHDFDVKKRSDGQKAYTVKIPVWVMGPIDDHRAVHWWKNHAHEIPNGGVKIAPLSFDGFYMNISTKMQISNIDAHNVVEEMGEFRKESNKLLGTYYNDLFA